MPSEMVGIWGQFCLHDNIHLGNKTSLVLFSVLKKYVFVFYSGSVGYYRRVVLSEAVDGCICFTRKFNVAVTESDLNCKPGQGPKNDHNFLMTVRPLS